MSLRNASQVGLGSRRPESSRPGSTRPGHLGLVLYSLLFSIIRMPVPFFFMCFVLMFIQQKFEGIMFGRIYILGLSILTILAY